MKNATGGQPSVLRRSAISLAAWRYAGLKLGPHLARVWASSRTARAGGLETRSLVKPSSMNLSGVT